MMKVIACSYKGRPYIGLIVCLRVSIKAHKLHDECSVNIKDNSTCSITNDVVQGQLKVDVENRPS